MCLICVEFQKQRMTTGEARRALGEMVESMEDEHIREVEEMLADADQQQADAGDGTDGNVKQQP